MNYIQGLLKLWRDPAWWLTLVVVFLIIPKKKDAIISLAMVMFFVPYLDMLYKRNDKEKK